MTGGWGKDHQQQQMRDSGPMEWKKKIWWAKMWWPNRFDDGEEAAFYGWFRIA
jgi:hypothetical protein